MDLGRADILCEKIVAVLGSVCQRVQIAGSVRRRKAKVGDIEVVLIPKMVLIQPDLFNFDGTQEYDRDPGLALVLNNMGRTIRGNVFTGKYVAIDADDSEVGRFRVDVFVATRENWGLILAIRTGSAGFSHSLARLWCRKGYHSRDGMLRKQERTIDVREERDLFKLLDLPFIDPCDREEPL